MKLSFGHHDLNRAARTLGLLAVTLALVAPAISRAQDEAQAQTETARAGEATAAERPSQDPARALEILEERGAKILSRKEFRDLEPRRLVAETTTSFRCNRVACICSGVSDCLDLIDSGLCSDFYCSPGPECACHR